MGAGRFSLSFLCSGVGAIRWQNLFNESEEVLVDLHEDSTLNGLQMGKGREGLASTDLAPNHRERDERAGFAV